MRPGTPGPLLRHVRQVAGNPGPLTDRQLLDRFAARADATAFAALVRRHGRLVLAACRQVLADEADVEDAFQATFLVLLRKAGAGRWHTSIGGWLFGVAHRVALKARAGAHRRRRCEAEASARRPEAVAAPDLSWREACAALHEELDRLPDKYRLPVLLCHLRGLSRDEAAAALGWSANAVKWRLERGRELLRARLTRRGIALSAGLLPALAAPRAQAVPASLVGATLNAVFGTPAERSAALAALLCPGIWTTRYVALLLGALIFGAAGAGAWCLAPAGTAGAPPAAQARTPAAPGPPAAPAPPEETVTLNGRVFGPDGKPFPGAALYTFRLPPGKRPSDEYFEAVERGTSGPDGRYRFNAPKEELGKTDDGSPMPVLAAADGYGVNWGGITQPGEELTLRLVKDQPIAGRLLDTEGRAVANATIRVRALYTGSDDSLDGFLRGWKAQWQDSWSQVMKRTHPPRQAVRVTPTDRDGRFRITGAGAERLVFVEVKAPAIAQTMIYIVGRAGFDPKPYNQAADSRMPGLMRPPGATPQLYGPTFDLVAAPGKALEGVVREAGGRPIAGARVMALAGWNNPIAATADAQGRFTLTGLPKQTGYSLHVMPGDKAPLLARSVNVPDTEGLLPVKAEIELTRGVVVTGRVIDKQTGRGVPSGIRFVPLPENTFFGKPGYDSYKHERLMNSTDRDGRFRLPVIPGPGVLMVQAQSGESFDGQYLNPYLLATFDEEGRKHVKLTKEGNSSVFTAADNAIEFLGNEHAVKWIDLAPDAGSVTVDFFLHRGKTAKLTIQDPDGRPLTGAIVAGVTAAWPITFALKTAECPVYALDPAKPRTLAVYHPGRNLGGRVVVRGDEAGPVVAKLQPAGTVTGRILDPDGQPLAGGTVVISYPSNSASELDRHLQQQRPPVQTDKDGRFKLEGVVPGLKFAVNNVRKGDTMLVPEPRTGLKEVASGATLELGDVRTKPWVQ